MTDPNLTLLLVSSSTGVIVYPQGVDEIMLQAKRELAAQYTNKLTVIASDTTITTILKLRVELLRIFSEVEGEIG